MGAVTLCVVRQDSVADAWGPGTAQNGSEKLCWKMSPHIVYLNCHGFLYPTCNTVSLLSRLTSHCLLWTLGKIKYPNSPCLSQLQVTFLSLGRTFSNNPFMAKYSYSSLAEIMDFHTGSWLCGISLCFFKPPSWPQDSSPRSSATTQLFCTVLVTDLENGTRVKLSRSLLPALNLCQVPRTLFLLQTPTPRMIILRK